MDNFLAAAKAYQEGRFEDAEAGCRAVLSRMPSHPDARLLLASILLGREQFAEADTIVAEAMADHSNDPDWLNLRGVALARLGRREQALDFFDRAVELRLLFPAAQANLLALLAERRDPTPRFRVSIITSTIGSPHLPQTIASVQEQTYPFVEHAIVADGPECRERVRACLPDKPRHPVYLLELPFNVGGGGYCGHRSYAALSFLVGGHYIGYLDDDNWLEPDHIASLMAKITSEGLAWAYSLRKIVDRQGAFIANDDCESLGLWPTWYDANVHHVDGNCYLFRRDLAVTTSTIWHRRFRDGESPDFVVCRQLLKEHPRCGGNGAYTVNYRAGNTAASVNADFFLRGNAVMKQRYGDAMPWRAALT